MVQVRRGEHDAVVRCRVESSRSGQRAALPRRSRQVPSRGSNQRPSGRQHSPIPWGRRHRSHSPPARSNRTRRLSSGQFLGYRGRSSGRIGMGQNAACTRRFASRTHQKRAAADSGAAKGREKSRGSPTMTPLRAGRLWRSSHRERQIGVGIGWPGAGSGRGGGSIGGGGAGLGIPVAARGRCCRTCCPPLTPDLLVLATKQLRKLLGALLGVRTGEDHHVTARRRCRCRFLPRATPGGCGFGIMEYVNSRPSRARPLPSPLRHDRLNSPDSSSASWCGSDPLAAMTASLDRIAPIGAEPHHPQSRIRLSARPLPLAWALANRKAPGRRRREQVAWRLGCS